MLNLDIQFANKPLLFSDIFQDIKHPDIAKAAGQVLQQNIERGLDSWYDTQSYIEIIAQQAPEDLIVQFPNLLKSDSPQVASLTAESIKKLPPNTDLGYQFLQLVSLDCIPAEMQLALTESLLS